MLSGCFLFFVMVSCGLLSQIADRKRPQFYCLTIGLINTGLFVILRRVEDFGLVGMVIALIFSAIIMVAAYTMSENMT